MFLSYIEEANVVLIGNQFLSYILFLYVQIFPTQVVVEMFLHKNSIAASYGEHLLSSKDLS